MGVQHLKLTFEAVSESFLQSPLYNTDYQHGFGTLYTAVYRPEEGIAQWHWPNAVWEQSFDEFNEGHRQVHYSATGARVATSRSRARSRVLGQEASPGNQRHQWTETDQPEVLIPVLTAFRAGLSAGSFDISPELATWFDEAERGPEIPWEKLGSACARQFDLH
ncbi:MAG: hypothetical protein GY792_03565 [Gammaproteobacteria bacterium]|nr:hypothetical protein [Gammaproteobacteria bacterium]